MVKTINSGEQLPIPVLYYLSLWLRHSYVHQLETAELTELQGNKMSDQLRKCFCSDFSFPVPKTLKASVSTLEPSVSIS